jgi:hypothetical protein
MKALHGPSSSPPNRKECKGRKGNSKDSINIKVLRKHILKILALFASFAVPQSFVIQ